MPISHPGTGASSYSGSESDITLSSSVSPFNFDALGKASANATLTVGGSKTIKVVAETGFVYAP